MTTKAAPTSLRAMAEGKDAEGITKQTIFRIDPNLIEFEKNFNLRQPGPDLDAHIERLYNAMDAGAFIPPVDVQVIDGKVIARDGHCRTLAARKLRKKEKDFTLECRQLRGNEADAVLHMLGSGTGGKPLTPLEAGLGYLRLTRMGMTAQQMADKLGVSTQTINNGLTLAEAPVDVQKLIIEGKVSATLAREAMKKGKEAVAELKAKAKELDATPDVVDKKGKKKKKKVTAKKLKKKKAKDADTETTTPPPDDPENITISVPRDVAQECVLKIKSAATGPELKQLASILELALV